MPGKTAFILAGGASRGAYQAGCLKRLEEADITPDLMIGSSIGVCNSLVYASGGAEALWAFWSGATSLPAVFSPSVRHNPIFGNSLFSMDGLINFTPDMQFAIQAQYDNISESFGFLGRFRWEFRPGSEILIALGQSALIPGTDFRFQTTALSVRIGHTLRF